MPTSSMGGCEMQDYREESKDAGTVVALLQNGASAACSGNKESM